MARPNEVKVAVVRTIGIAYDHLMASFKFRKMDEETRRREAISTELARRKKQLDCYIEAFAGTELESDPALEEAGVEAWLEADPPKKPK